MYCISDKGIAKRALEAHNEELVEHLVVCLGDRAPVKLESSQSRYTLGELTTMMRCSSSIIVPKTSSSDETFTCHLTQRYGKAPLIP